MKISLLGTTAALALLSSFFVPQQGGREPVEVLFSPTGNKRLLQKQISGEIADAKKQIIVAVYHFTSKQLAESLANAKRRGVDVRVLVDGAQNDSTGPYGEALKILTDAGVPLRRVYPDGNPSGRSSADRAKFHHKFCVIDGMRIITGSFNWTVLADEENHENLLFLSNRKTALQYIERFEMIWKDEKIAKE